MVFGYSSAHEEMTCIVGLEKYHLKVRQNWDGGYGKFGRLYQTKMVKDMPQLFRAKNCWFATKLFAIGCADSQWFASEMLVFKIPALERGTYGILTRDWNGAFRCQIISKEIMFLFYF